MQFAEYEYNPSQWTSKTKEEAKQVVEHFIRNALEVRKRIIKETNCDLDIEYASNGKNTKLDIYYPDTSKTGKNDVLILIHGGYWQVGSKEIFSFLAHQTKAFNWIAVVPGYDIAPYGSIENMVQQIKLAVVFTAKKFPDSRLFLCGHSAGAHLSAMMLNTDWDDCEISIKKQITGICTISGIFDLVPLIPTSVNEPALKLDKATAIQISPMTLTASKGLKLKCRVLIAVGALESSEFHRQSKEYYQLLKDELPRVTLLEIPGVSHFDIVEHLVEKDYSLTKAIYNWMKDDL